jgi:putative membrane protein
MRVSLPRSATLAGSVAVVVTLGAQPALAHEGMPPAPHDLWTAWSSDPAVIVGLGFAALAYARGVRELWRRAGPGHGVRRWAAAAFGGGLVALFLALVSPLDALGTALFSAHMLQHLMLVAIAAPLLVLGAPLLPFLWALPPGGARAVGGRWHRARPARAAWRLLTRPLVGWALHAAALWAWHLPLLYQAALQSHVVHVLEHATFLGTALVFWWTVLRAGPRVGTGYAVGVLSLFTMSLQGGVLGALMTFSRVSWYPAYAETVGAWGLTPLEDQQLAGLIMWIPASVVYLAAALALLGLRLLAEPAPARRVHRSTTDPMIGR